MKKYKSYRRSQIDRMSDSERKEYYQNAVDHYGNLPDQLKGYRAKALLHPLLLLIARTFPAKVIKINDVNWQKNNLPVIFSANHSNSNDFPILAQTIHRHCFVLADYTMINDRMVCLATRLNGCVYVDRKSKTSTANAYNQCVEGVKSGYHLIVFPESTWNLTKSLPVLPRYWGDVKIARETGRPIIPVILEYTGKYCFVKFGECIYVAKDDSVAEKDKEVYDAMVRLKKEIRQSEAYQKHYVPIEYTDWLRKSIKSYQYFDVPYEMSCIRNDGSIQQDELNEILKVGEEIRPVKSIKKNLKYARINYRYGEE